MDMVLYQKKKNLIIETLDKLILHFCRTINVFRNKEHKLTYISKFIILGSYVLQKINK